MVRVGREVLIESLAGGLSHPRQLQRICKDASDLFSKVFRISGLEVQPGTAVVDDFGHCSQLGDDRGRTLGKCLDHNSRKIFVTSGR